MHGSETNPASHPGDTPRAASGTNPLWEVPQSSSTTGRQQTRKRKGRREAANTDSVARVIVDVPLAHLDRPFDYRVPARLDRTAVPGCRVRVRFAGQLVDGFLIERTARSEHPGRLAFLERVLSDEQVVPPRLLTLARAVAQRYGGTLVDVLRLAVPPRHATVEAEPARMAASVPREPADTGWPRYPRGPAFLDALRNRRPARSVWQALPDEDWPTRLAELACVVAAQGRSSVLVLPDHRDVARLHAACTTLVESDAVVALSADLGPAERYRRWLAVLRGVVRIVIGTRSAMFAPVHDPGLYVVWDDGDDLHIDPHTPYPQVRDVLMLRAQADEAALLIAGHNRTAEAQLLLEADWAHSITPDRATLREHIPRVTPTGEDFDLARDEAARAARLPAVAFEAARAGLGAGLPVLVQVPRRGYVPGIACGSCRESPRCRRCAGPLLLSESGRPPHCRWCDGVEADYRCASCGSTKLRAVMVGAARTAEELGRAFPGVPVRTSGGGHLLTTVPSAPALIVTTPGAEPEAQDGYGAALLLDGWVLLGRQDLRAAEETLRRWMAAAALVRTADAGGRVIVSADAELPVAQALLRWDPGWHAGLELAERAELGFPPAMRMASFEGAPEGVGALLDEIDLPDSAEILGPVPLGEVDADGRADRERALVRIPRTEGRALAAAVYSIRARRDARKTSEPVRIQLDPRALV